MSQKINEKLDNLSEKKLQLYKIRHSAEHVLMQAMENLGYDLYKAMGPATEDGFYFDFEMKGSQSVSQEDFEKIEREMRQIVDKDLPFVRQELSTDKARELFKDNPYKQEWINETESRGEVISVYWTGKPDGENSFVDLCAGPHVRSTGQISAFKLLSIAGAYWRGDENNKMLTRIYGTAFPTQDELDEFLKMRTEAEKRDHRKLGKRLELFTFHETAPGAPYWLPNGLTILNELLKFWREQHRKRGYLETSTPLVNKKELFETSGHWEHYKEEMFIANMGENEVYGVKPMNCPNAMIIFDSKTRSYKDLPLRLSDSDVLHRYERSGTLNGLLRVRSFRQDDSHNFIRHNQIKEEYSEIMDIVEKFYSIFDMQYEFRLGTRPDGFLGDIKTWDRAEKQLKEILNEKVGEGNYSILEGDGAFYGPKVDILMKDVLGREWQMGTIQLDFQLPERFDLNYIDENGEKQRPVVVHRVIYGSLERFIGILTEHFAGAFPVWLHPTQVIILPIGKDHHAYANSVMKKLGNKLPNSRVEVDKSDETLNNKIRKAQEMKIPYMLIVGDRELKNNQVSLRLRSEENRGAIDLENFTNRLESKIESKSLDL